MSFEPVANAVVEGDANQARGVVEGLLASGSDPEDLVNEGLVAGMRIVGDKWNKMEIFLPEVMMAVEAWQAAMDVVEPHLLSESREGLRRGVVVIGTVKGDIHDIGKNIVGILLKTAGFEVHDLGTDVMASAFVSKAEDVKADAIALSALMTTTMPFQRDVVDYLEMRGERDKYFVLVGGGATTQEWADEIGADAYGKTAEDAIRLLLSHLDARGS